MKSNEFRKSHAMSAPLLLLLLPVLVSVVFFGEFLRFQDKYGVKPLFRAGVVPGDPTGRKNNMIFSQDASKFR